MRRTLPLLLAALLAAAPLALAQEPDAQENVPPDAQPTNDPSQPNNPDDAFEDNGTLENIQQDPTDPGGHVSWWGPYLFGVAAVGAVLLFVVLRRWRRQDL